jgi:hypothetical protein
MESLRATSGSEFMIGTWKYARLYEVRQGSEPRFVASAW